VPAFTVGGTSIPSRQQLIRPVNEQTFLSGCKKEEGLYYKQQSKAFDTHYNFQDMQFKPSDFSFMKVLRSMPKPKEKRLKKEGADKKNGEEES